LPSTGSPAQLTILTLRYEGSEQTHQFEDLIGAYESFGSHIEGDRHPRCTTPFVMDPAVPIGMWVRKRVLNLGQRCHEPGDCPGCVARRFDRTGTIDDPSGYFTMMVPIMY
jgi:hypothetical protein